MFLYIVIYSHTLLKKMFFLKLNFQDEGHLRAISLFFILIFYHKCFAFQFLCCGIGLHISMLTGVQNMLTGVQTLR